MAPSDPQRDRSGERAGMVSDQLERRGVQSSRVLEVMRRIPRERFVLPAFESQAYSDAALAIDCGQTISQPYMVARMTELLELEPQQCVLEIGTGSGYQTAILASLAAHVDTIEWHLKLMTQAAERLEALGLSNVTYRCGDGSRGWPERAPYDAILVTAGAPAVPEELCAQLAPGGRLVVPVGGALEQTLLRIRRGPEGCAQEEFLQCRFVKLVGQAGWRD